ncbi:hypothetical protein D9M72_250280 [compost metagenome]
MPFCVAQVVTCWWIGTIPPSLIAIAVASCSSLERSLSSTVDSAFSSTTSILGLQYSPQLVVPKPFLLSSHASSARSGELTSPVCAPQPSSPNDHSCLMPLDEYVAIGMPSTLVAMPMRVRFCAMVCAIFSSLT